MHLFEEDGDLASSKTIKRNDILDILDNIPPSLLATLRNKAMAKTTTLEVQTDETHDWWLNKEEKPKPKSNRQPSSKAVGGNVLMRSINKYMNSKKEKVQAMPETNAIKMIETLLDERMEAEIDNEIHK